MKPVTRSFVLLITAVFILFSTVFGKAMPAPQGESDDKTLSPYFFVKSDDSTVDQLPLKSTSANVNIAGVIADVTVAQVYKNEGKKALEAIYVFPASTKAAVYGMKMTIGKRVIETRINKRDEAIANTSRQGTPVKAPLSWNNSGQMFFR
jgi:Ca-activated chloride channel family protein